MRLRTLIPTIAILALAVRCAAAGERDAVVWLGGCTGFVVEKDLLVTAKHCRHPQTITVSIQGRSVTARKVYTDPGGDGPVVFHLEGGPFESLPVARRKPEIGEPVYSLGYPGGHWARIEGQVIGGNGKDVNYTNHRVATGSSGGPLLNAQGEVVGVALFVDADIGVHRSGFAGWRVTTEAIRAARAAAPVRRSADAPPPRYRRRPVVVVFSSDRCPACRALADDVTAGHFRDYEFHFVKWNEEIGQWSDPDVYQAFLQACRPDRESLAFPTIWVQGTDRYRVGYSAARRGGLLQWLASAVQALVEAIIGREEPPEFPQPPVSPNENSKPPARKEATPSPEVSLLQLARDVAALRDEALKTKAELKSFQESGVIGKIKAIARLKEEKDMALERVAAVRADVDRLRQDLAEEPLQFLWGLLGLLSGLLHRRFAN